MAIEAREHLDLLWVELRKAGPALHKLAQTITSDTKLTPDQTRLVAWAVTACALEISCRAVEEQTNHGSGAN